MSSLATALILGRGIPGPRTDCEVGDWDVDETPVIGNSLEVGTFASAGDLSSKRKRQVRPFDGSRSLE
jgi:hypothetical protein